MKEVTGSKVTGQTTKQASVKPSGMRDLGDNSRIIFTLFFNTFIKKQTKQNKKIIATLTKGNRQGKAMSANKSVVRGPHWADLLRSEEINASP